VSLTERDCLKEYDIKLLILSRGRSATITTHKVFPSWVEVLVPESEKELYEKSIDNPILTIPDKYEGLGQVRNWVLSHIKENTVVMIDDDIKYLYCLTGEKTKRVNDPDEVVQVVINTAVMANDLGVHCFGFAQTDIRKYKPTEPFRLCGWVGCVIGVIGRKYDFRDDKYKVDIDYCMKNLLVDRILWIDDRWLFSQERDNNVGGNSIFRTKEEYEKSTDSLCEKWKGFIKKRMHKNQIRLTTNVGRRQVIKYD